MRLKVIHLQNFLEKLDRDLDEIFQLTNSLKKDRFYSEHVLISLEQESSKLKFIKEKILNQIISNPPPNLINELMVKNNSNSLAFNNNNLKFNENYNYESLANQNLKEEELITFSNIKNSELIYIEENKFHQKNTTDNSDLESKKINKIENVPVNSINSVNNETTSKNADLIIESIDKNNTQNVKKFKFFDNEEKKEASPKPIILNTDKIKQEVPTKKASTFKFIFKD